MRPPRKSAAVRNCVCRCTRLALALAVFGTATAAYGQQLPAEWTRYLSLAELPSRDESVGNHVTENDHVYVLGNKGRAPFGSAAVLNKLDPAGSTVWTADQNGPPYTKALTLAVDGHGDPYVLSRVRTDDDQWLTRVVRYIAGDGGIAWVYDVEGVPGSLVVDSAGHAFVTMERSIDGREIRSIVKLGLNGDELWSRAIETGIIVDVVADENGGVFALLSGSTYDPEYRRVALISAIGRDGTQKWLKEIASSSSVTIPKTLQLADALHVSGAARGLFAAQVDPVTGETISYSVHPEGYLAMDMTVDDAGSAYVIGHGTANRTCKDECPDDFITVKFDPSGKALWSARYDAVEHFGREYPNDILLDDHGQVIVTGVSDGVTTISYDAADGSELWTLEHPGRSPHLGRFASGDLILTRTSPSSEWDADIYAARLDGSDGDGRWTTAFNGQPVPDGWMNRFRVDRNGSSHVVLQPCHILQLDGDGDRRWSLDIENIVGSECAVVDILPHSDGAVGFVAVSESAETDIIAGTVSLGGRVDWIRSVALSTSPRAADVVVASDDGGFAVVSGGSTLTALRFDWDGTERWQSVIDPPDVLSANAADVFIRGNSLYVLAAVEKDVVYNDVAVFNLDYENGEVRWQRTMGGTAHKSDHPVEVRAGPYESVFALGELRDAVGSFPNVARNVLVRFSAQGDSLWSSELDSEKPIALEIGPDGSAYTAAISLQSNDSHRPYADLIYDVRKHGLDGENLWTTVLNTGPGSFMEPPDLRYVASHLWVIGKDTLYSATGRREPAVTMLNSAGEIGGSFWLSPQRYPSMRVVGVGVDADGNVYVGGNMERTPTVVKYSGAQLPVSIDSVPERLETDASAPYPNPVRNRMSVPVRSSEPSSVQLQIIDMLGRTVLRTPETMRQPGDTTISADVSSLASGVYLYILTVGSKRFSGSLVVAR